MLDKVKLDLDFVLYLMKMHLKDWVKTEGWPLQSLHQDEWNGLYTVPCEWLTFSVTDVVRRVAALVNH